ncbi:MAG: type II/IV secretion system protein, partial [Thermodesulfobacteriota bacterium]
MKKATKEKELSLEYVYTLLKEKDLLSDEQCEELRIKGEAQRARLQKKQASGSLQRRLHAVNEMVSPAEVIITFEFNQPGTDKPLTEDMITEIIAEDVGLPYLKIDALKLNLDLVTSNIPRPFAQKHLVV